MSVFNSFEIKMCDILMILVDNIYLEIFHDFG